MAFRFAMMVEKAAVGRGRRREKEGEKAGKYALLIKPQARRNELLRPQVSVCRIHKGETKRLRRDGAQNSVKNGVHFGTHRSRVSVHANHEVLTLVHPAREVRVFKAAGCG